ncbi:MAG TPA: hypothetical protein DDW42_06190 [Desulfobacteraceae bacterium]|nr:hypothetical protein [Desulfobacteraceae bacterium]
MEVICSSCKAKLIVSDKKIVPGKRVIITCPRCKNKLVLEPYSHEEKQLPTVTKKKSEPRPSYVEKDTLLESYDEGIKLAMVMANETKQVEKLGRSVKSLGYKYISAHNTGEAISKIRLHHFDLVILCDGFDGIEIKQNPVLQYLNHISMSIRRNIFLAMIGNSFDTMDNMISFAMSANVVINWKDVDKLTAILEKAISDNKRFYKVFKDTLTEIGKA